MLGRKSQAGEAKDENGSCSIWNQVTEISLMSAVDTLFTRIIGILIANVKWKINVTIRRLLFCFGVLGQGLMYPRLALN